MLGTQHQDIMVSPSDIAAVFPDVIRHTEIPILRAAPAPLFLLEPDGTIRRANNRAGDLIGAPPGYATGKALTAFVDPASRAAVQSQLAAATRTGAARQADCTLLGPDGPVAATLTASVLTDGARLLVVTMASPPETVRGGLPGGSGGMGPPRVGLAESSPLASTASATRSSAPATRSATRVDGSPSGGVQLACSTG